jgi:RHS repeat-associated protein
MKSIFQKRWAHLKRTTVLGCLVLFFCLSQLSSLYAADPPHQNLNIWFEFEQHQTYSPYCSGVYDFQLIMHWSFPQQGSACYFNVYVNGVPLGYPTGGTSYRICSGSGCFGSYSDFLSFVNNVLKGCYYNSTIVLEAHCQGVPTMVDQITIGDQTSVMNGSQPSPMKQVTENKTTTVAEPINVATGNMSTSQTDILIPAKEIPLELSRTYNSQDDFNGQFGYGWRSNFDITLTEYPDCSVVEEDEGGVYTIYTKNLMDGSYTPSAGKYSVLTKNSDLSYTIVRKHGRILTFDVQGRLIKIQERNGNTVNILRNYNGKITEVDDASGRKLLFTLDSLGRTTQITDPSNRIWAYAYDANGNLSQVTDPLNNVTTYQYDSNHKLVQKTDANNHALYFVYDSFGRAYHSWQDGNVNEVTLSFDPTNQATTVTDSRNNATKYEYNTYGLVTKITDAQNNIQTAVWDANLNKTSSTDQNAHTTNYTYDSRGNLLTTTDPLNNITTFTYEPVFDFIQTTTDAQGNVTTRSYDTKGNLITRTDPLGDTTTNTYDAFGELVTSTNPKNCTTNFTYDTYGNLATTIDALNNTTTFSYDILGNRTQIKDAQNNITQFTYNNLNQLTQITYPDNSKVSYGYDSLGNKTLSTDNASNTFTYTYDLNNHVISTTNPLGKTIAFEYDTEGNRIKVTDQNLNQTSYQYDSLNRLLSETNPLSLTKSYAYDPVGNRTGVTDAKGNIITYEYDSLNHLTKINYPSGSAVSFTYDSLGRRLTMTDSQGVSSYTYDKLGRLTQVQGPGQNNTLQYTYDALGNRISLILPGSKTVQYTYDALNRLASIIDPNNKTTTYAYDSVGNPLNVIYPNGIQATYAFDALHRLTHLTNQQQSGNQTKLSEFSYTYDQAGRRSKVVLLDGEIDYTYDAFGELTQENKSSGSNPYQTSYEYDPAGNRIQMVKDGKERLYTYNNANQLTKEAINGPATVPITVTGTASDANGIQSVSVNGINATLNGNNFSCQISLSAGVNTLTVNATDVANNTATKSINVTYNQAKQTLYLYDNNGNLVSKQSVDQTLNLSYDYENRLNAVVSGGMNITYGYDGEGKRISTTNGSTVTNYLYDGMDVVLERNNAGGTTLSYLRNPYAAGGIGGIINTQQGTAPENYYSYDGLGSVTNLSDASGANAQSYSYDAFGNTLTSQGTLSNTHKFLTKETDFSGLIYFGARYYDPTIGRFITQDPLGMIDGPNMYVYVNNNPVNLIDPWGLCIKEDWLAELGLGYIAEVMIAAGFYAGENAVLFSGPGSKILAAASSGIPIFKTFIGGAMNWVEESFNISLPRVIWDVASAIYATTAKGTVQVFLTESDYSSTFARIEAPIIEALGKAEMIFK